MMTTEAENGSPAAQRALRATGSAVLELATWCLAILGIISVGLVIAAFALGIRPLMISTGSMDPTIPPNSVVLVQEIPAEEAEVGEIINVQTESMTMPVIHRVIEVSESETYAAAIRMQGDANDRPDVQTYEVDVVEKYLWHMPGVATTIDKISSPLGFTILAALVPVIFFIVFWDWGAARRSRSEQREVSAQHLIAYRPRHHKV